MRLPSFRCSRLLAALALSLVAGFGLAGRVAAATSEEIVIRYQLVTEFAGTGKAGGRIAMTLVNRSLHALAEVTVRLADPSVGRLTGPVQEELDLAAGETRRVEGEFVLDTDLLHAARPLEWIVVYTDPQGFARQLAVTGEPLPSVIVDAGAHTAVH